VDAAIEAAEERAAALARGGREREALEAHREAIARAQALGRPRLAAAILHRIGRAKEAANDSQGAVLAYESALRALVAEGDLGLDAVISRLTNPDVGKQPIRSAVPAPSDLYAAELPQELATAEADPLLVVRVLMGIGNAYAAMPQDAVALARYEEALGRGEIAGAPALRARVLGNLAEMQRRLERREEAHATLVEAWRALASQADRREQRRMLMVRGALERDLGRTAEARQTYREAVALYREARDGRGEGLAQAGLGQLLLGERQLVAAGEAFERALACGREANDDDLVWRAAQGLGEVRRRLGDFRGAVEALQAAHERIEKMRQRLATDEGKVAFQDLARTVADSLIETYLDLAHPHRGTCADAGACREAVAVIEGARGRALEELMACARTPQDRAPGAVPTCDGAIRRYGVVEMASGVECADVPASIAESVAQMATGVRSASRAIRRPRLDRLARPERERATRMVFHVLDDRTAVFVVSPDGRVRGHVAPLGRAELTARVRALRLALGVEEGGRGSVLLMRPPSGSLPRRMGTPEDLLEQLHRALVEPLAAALPAPGELLVLEPHDVLWLVPFAALRQADGHWLGDRWPLLYAPSEEALEEVRGRERATVRPRSELSALVIGDPVGRQYQASVRGLSFAFLPLPWAADEARAVHALFAGGTSRLLLSPSADLGAVLSEIEQKDVIHLAAHGIALPDHPLDSFILLTPSSRCRDLFTARQATLLSLRADLVVLSACQTGLGRVTADGMIGFARSFLAAGARTVVVSQWSVSDRATAELMKAYYREYLGGTDKAAALQRAMRQVRPAFADVRLWAPFVVFGSEL
jgi:CHAT domain-containing protein/tetratricopeptide (TPR) repeat protein